MDVISGWFLIQWCPLVLQSDEHSQLVVNKTGVVGISTNVTKVTCSDWGHYRCMATLKNMELIEVWELITIVGQFSKYMPDLSIRLCLCVYACSRLFSLTLFLIFPVFCLFGGEEWAPLLEFIEGFHRACLGNPLSGRGINPFISKGLRELDLAPWQ